MQFRQRKALEALRSIQAYLENHRDRLADVNATGTRTALNGVVLTLEALGDQQDPARFQRDSTIQAGSDARFELRETHMRPISRISLLARQDKPEINELRMPHRTFDLTSLAAWAREMVKAAEPHAETFIAHGLPTDFIDKMKAATEEVQKVADARSAATQTRQGATKAVHAEVRRAVGIIGVLDALVMPRVRNNVQLEEGWRVAKRFARRAVKSAVEATAPSTTGESTGSSTPSVTAPAPSSGNTNTNSGGSSSST